jgi:hypothetical protein
MKRTCLALGLILYWTSTSFAQTRSITVSALGNGVKETSEIRAFRFAALEETRLVRLGDKFEVGDELTGTGQVGIELRCPEGSLVKFSQKFRAVIVAPQSTGDCAINLLAGKADITTNRPTSIASGEITAGSKGTIYSLRAVRDAQGTNVACSVFDGEVAVSTRSTEGSLLAMGSKRVWAPGGGALEKISADEIKQTAALYADLDLSKGRTAGAAISRSSAAELEAAYLRVLQSPSDAEARIELAAGQVNLRIASEALYHLDRAARLAPETDKPQLARIAAVRSAAHAQAGDHRQAAEQAAIARRIDPDVANSKALAKYRIEPKLLQAPGR